MKTSLFIAAALAAVADASTTVAVLELGKGGAVRRTTARKTDSTVSGVASFWSQLHGGRLLQHAGMSVVPDLFNKPDSGLVLGLMGSGLDLSAMPTVSALVEKEGNHVVGHFSVEGAYGHSLLQKAGPSHVIEPASLVSSAINTQKGLSVMSVSVDDKNVADVDSQVAALIESLHKKAVEAGNTVILHLVVEEEEGASRRRLISRRLEEEDQEEEDQEQKVRALEEAEDADEDAENANGNGYYGYGYYNAYGEWVTPYKTMFQIQYFNIVLWTAVGLTLILFFSVFLMINMPLMADTLLFGESAKMSFE